MGPSSLTATLRHMILFLLLILLILAVGGGFYVHPLLWFLLIAVLVIWLFSGPIDGGPWYDRRWR